MSGQHRVRRSDVGTLRATRFTKPRRPAVAELVHLLEDVFPTQPLRMQGTDTVRLAPVVPA